MELNESAFGARGRTRAGCAPEGRLRERAAPRGPHRACVPIGLVRRDRDIDVAGRAGEPAHLQRDAANRGEPDIVTRQGLKQRNMVGALAGLFNDAPGGNRTPTCGLKEPSDLQVGCRGVRSSQAGRGLEFPPARPWERGCRDSDCHFIATPGRDRRSGDALGQPRENFLLVGLASGDPLDHRHIDIRQRAVERRAIALKEETHEEERGALVAVRQRMIP